jgi:hypothetical protein
VALRYAEYLCYDGYDFSDGQKVSFTTPLTVYPISVGGSLPAGNNTADVPITIDNGFGYATEILQLLTYSLDIVGQSLRFFETSQGVIGYLGGNGTTYLKESSGKYTASGWFSVPTTLLPSVCKKYVGWDLPADEVKKQCDKDSNCDGFIMKSDNSHGDLCKFAGKGNMTIGFS